MVRSPLLHLSVLVCTGPVHARLDPPHPVFKDGDYVTQGQALTLTYTLSILVQSYVPKVGVHFLPTEALCTSTMLGARDTSKLALVRAS